MKKKTYQQPALQIVTIKKQPQILSGSGGTGIHDDDPQPPGGAMSRDNDGWEDDDFDVM